MPLDAGQTLYQILSSSVGKNEFEFSLKGSGTLFIDGKKVPFACENGGKACVAATFKNVRNIKVGVVAHAPVEVYGAVKK